MHQVDAGIVLVDGKPIEIRDPQHAQELGIALVAQELSLAPALSVLDNIWLGNREVPLFHRRKEFRERARAALEKVGLGDLPLETPVSQLSIGRRQLVEIARMLTRNARVFILDEPTATLSDVEIERIFNALRALKAEGKSIIYITHRLGEVFQICDSVTVLRNGELVGTRRTTEIDRAHLMEMMLGRSLGEMYPRWESKPGEPMLVVKNLAVPPVVQDFNLTAQRGMVICLAGQVGSGAIEVLRALAGLAYNATGEVERGGTGDAASLGCGGAGRQGAVHLRRSSRRGGISPAARRREPGRDAAAGPQPAGHPRATQPCARPRQNSPPQSGSTARGCARMPTS